MRRRETKEYVKKDGAVTGSSPKVTRSIEITYLLNLSDLWFRGWNWRPGLSDSLQSRTTTTTTTGRPEQMLHAS